MHKLLARQVRRFFGGAVPAELGDFIRAVEEAYQQFDDERELLERSLEMTSDELVAHNRRLREELESGREMREQLEEELHERSRIEEALRRSKVRLDEAQHLAGIGYWEWNVKTGEADWSSEMYRMFGYEPGTVTPSYGLFLRHCRPEQKRVLVRYMLSARAGQARPVQVGIRHNDGAERTLLTSACFAADAAGNLSDAFGICLDVTEQRSYEQRLIGAREQAEAARQHAEELLQLKTTLLANIGHELRTPLAAIIGFSDILSADLEGEHREFAQLIGQSGERLLSTFNSVLTLASLEVEHTQLYVKPCDLAAEIGQVVRMMHGLAAESGLDLTLEVQENVHVRADPSSLHRILQNLIGNALKFTPQGGVTVRVGCLRNPGEPSYGFVAVQDTGRGISPAFLPYLFEAFHQESKGMDRTHEGVGLGLAIVQRLTEMMGGRVEVESTVDVGSTFTLYLPLAWEQRLSLVDR